MFSSDTFFNIIMTADNQNNSISMCALAFIIYKSKYLAAARPQANKMIDEYAFASRLV